MNDSRPKLRDDVMFQNESVPGTLKNRNLAQVIDYVLAGILVGFASALLTRKEIDEETITVIATLLWFAYPIALNWKFGFTVGKKIMKLQVVTPAGDHPSMGQILLRETIGRLISFPLGYLWAFFRADRAAWHDLISGTRVISTDPFAVENSMAGMKKFALTSGILGAISCSIIYFVFFTPLPFRQVAKNLEIAGYEVENVGGSIVFGPSVGRIAYSDDISSFDLQNVKFEYDLWSVFKKNRIRIKNLSVSSGKFTAKASFKNIMGEKRKEETSEEEKPDDKLTKHKKKNRTPPSVLVEKIDIANLRFEAEGKVLNLKRFYLDSFLVNDGKVTTKRFFLESDLLNIDIAGLTADKEEVKIADGIKGVIRQALFPKYLAGDVTFEGKLDIDIKNKNIRELAVGICDRRLQLRKEGDGFVMQTYGLTLSNCLVSSGPFTNASLKMKFKAPDYQPQVLEGQMWLKSANFRYSKQYGFVHTRGLKAYAFRFEPSMMWMMMGPSFPISINQFTNEEEWISDLYYGKPISQLASAEYGDVSKDLRYFRAFPEFKPKTPFMMQQQAIQQPAVNNQGRVPSSFGGRYGK